MVYQCMYCGKRIVKGVRFLVPFPLREEHKREWLKSLGMCTNYTQVKTLKICSDHFAKDQVRLNKKQLLPGSIPTLFSTRIWKFCICCGVHQYDASRPSLHSFPDKDHILLKMWLKALRANDIVPSKTSLICTNHFEDYCFKNHNRQEGLKASAVPSIFEGVPVKVLHVSHNKRPSEANYTLPIPPLKYYRESSLSRSSEESCVDSNRNDTHQSTHSERLIELLSAQEELRLEEDALAKNSNIAIINNTSFKKNNNPPRDIYADHNYVIFPENMNKKLIKVMDECKKLKNVNRVRKQRIKRMQDRISNLNNILRELKKS